MNLYINDGKHHYVQLRQGHNQCQAVNEIKQKRLKESKAILDEYFTLASSSLDSSDGALRKAINYSLEQKNSPDS